LARLDLSIDAARRVSHTEVPVLVRVDEPEVVLGDILDAASKRQRPIAIIGPHTAVSIKGKGTSTKSQHLYISVELM
jgi:hypothetical protein